MVFPLAASRAKSRCSSAGLDSCPVLEMPLDPDGEMLPDAPPDELPDPDGDMLPDAPPDELPDPDGEMLPDAPPDGDTLPDAPPDELPEEPPIVPLFPGVLLPEDPAPDGEPVWATSKVERVRATAAARVNGAFIGTPDERVFRA